MELLSTRVRTICDASHRPQQRQPLVGPAPLRRLPAAVRVVRVTIAHRHRISTSGHIHRMPVATAVVLARVQAAAQATVRVAATISTCICCRRGNDLGDRTRCIPWTRPIWSPPHRPRQRPHPRLRVPHPPPPRPYRIVPFRPWQLRRHHPRPPPPHRHLRLLWLPPRWCRPQRITCSTKCRTRCC